MSELTFDKITPYVDGAGDTGRSARLKLDANFDKIKACLDNLMSGTDDGSGAFIRKDKDDTTDHSLTINANLTVKGTSTLTTAVITTLTVKDATITGALNTATITASGLITANAGVTATTLTTTGLATLARLSTPIADITELTAKNETVTGHLTTADITASGLITANAGVLATTLTTTGLATLATADIKGQATIEATMCSPDWASRTKGWGVTRAGAADFRNIYADELRVLAFTADISQALAGSDYLTKSVSKLSANFVVPAAGSAVRIIVDDLEGYPSVRVFSDGDYIRFRAFDRSAGLVIADVWGTVTLDTTFGNSGYTGGTQAYTFSCTKTSGAGLTIYKGSEVLDYGKSGDGLIKRTVLDAIGSPYEEIDTWTTSPTTANNYTVHVRMGSLIGLANCNGWGLYTDNAYLTSKVVVGDLTKKANYLEYNGTSLTVRGDIYLSSGQAAASTGSVTAAVNTAAADATTKANNAQTDAVNTAAADATTKANNAQTASKTYTDAQITVVNNSIALKVSQTDYNANNTAIGNRISAVEVTTAGISTRVDTVSDTATSALNNAQTAQTAADKANTDLSSYKTTVANTYSTIEQTSSSIDAKINTSVASGGAVYTAVASSFSMSGNGISLFGKTLNITGATIFSSLASKTEAENYAVDAANSIEIGGRNLFSMSKCVFGTGITLNSDIHGFEMDYNTTTTARIRNLLQGGNLGGGGDFTVSLYVKASATLYNLYVDICGKAANETLGNSSYIQVTTDYVKYKFVFSNVTNNIGYSYYGFLDFYISSTTDATLYVKDIKIERGTKATDWSPSPDDTQVGGRNLLLNSATRAYAAYATNGGSVSESVITDGVYSNVHQIYCNSASNGFYSSGIGGSTIRKTNDVFTISFWAKASQTTTLTECGLRSGGTFMANIQPSWQKFVHTFPQQSSVSDTTFVFNGSIPSGVYIYLRDVKIERGATATDWTEAPEDTTNAISNTQAFAINTAAADATTKANDAYSNAVSAANNAASAAASAAGTAAKNSIADKLGYSSWSAMESAARLTTTMIDGGYINTSLIKADEIVTKALVTSILSSDTAEITDLTVSTANLNSCVIDTATIKGTLSCSNATFTNGTFNSITVNTATINSATITSTCTVQGVLSGVSGSIGGFVIGDSTLTSTMSSNSMMLAANLIRFIGQYSSVYIGADVYPLSNGGAILGSERVSIDRTITGTAYGNVAKYISVKGSTPYDNDGYQYTGNHALYIPDGDICGFRLRSRRTSTSKTLDKMDSVIHCINSGEITITLPSGLEDGQIYMLMTGSGSTLIKSASSGGLTYDGNYKTTNTTVGIGCNDMLLCIYDSINSRWQTRHMRQT